MNQNVYTLSWSFNKQVYDINWEQTQHTKWKDQIFNTVKSNKIKGDINTNKYRVYDN